MKIMKTKFLRSSALLIAFTSWLLAGSVLQAQTPPAANLLRQAYSTLAVADHDYKGHRVEAMKQIEAAAKVLKMDLHGDGRGHEKQGVSDEQLRAARTLLEQARPQLSGKALKHIDKAVAQLNTALKIR